jgi:hypothetical protein
VRLSENGKLVERIVIKIRVFDNGKWEWKVRQRFIKEPRLKPADFIKILDELKAEIAMTEGAEVMEGPASKVEQPPAQQKKNKKKNNTS